MGKTITKRYAEEAKARENKLRSRRRSSISRCFRLVYDRREYSDMIELGSLAVKINL